MFKKTRRTFVSEMKNSARGVYPKELLGENSAEEENAARVTKNNPSGENLNNLRSEGIFLAKDPKGGGRLKKTDYKNVDNKRVSKDYENNSHTKPLSQKEIRVLKEKFGEPYIPQGNEDELLEAIDNKIAVEKKLAKKELAKEIFEFIEKNEKKFNQYRHYFKFLKAYFKDKPMLEKKLAVNQNANNPRQRVNAEALQDEITQMDNYLNRLKSNLEIDNLPLPKSLVEKIVNLSADRLKTLKGRLIDEIGETRKGKVQNKEKPENNIAA